MSKRVNYTPLNVSSTKKPRVDEPMVTLPNVQIGKTTQHLAKAAMKVNTNYDLNALDDDDLVAIGTQLESQVVVDSVQLEESFQGFANNIKNADKKTSTQAIGLMMPPSSSSFRAPPAPVQNNDLDDDDDTDLLLSQFNYVENLELKRQLDQAKPKQSTRPSNQRQFERKEQIVPSQMTVSAAASVQLKTMITTDLQTQVMQLKTTVQDKQREVETIKDEMKTFNAKIKIKEGQITQLKRDLENLRSENEKLKALKLQEEESSRKMKDFDEQMMAMTKEIHHLRSEVNTKQNECDRLRMKRSRLEETLSKETPVKIYKAVANFNWQQLIKPEVSHKIDEILLNVNPHEVPVRTSLLLNQLQTLASVLSASGTLPKSVNYTSVVQEVVQLTSNIASTFSSLPKIIPKDMEYPGAEDKLLARVLCNDIDAFKTCDGQKISIYDSTRVVSDEHDPVARRCIALFSIALRNEEICNTLSHYGSELFTNIQCALHAITHCEEMWKGIGYIAAFTEILSSITTNPVQLSLHCKPIVQIFKLLVNHSMINLEVLNSLATFLSKIKDPEVMSALCQPAPASQFTYKNIAMRFNRDCCPLLTFGVKVQVAMRHYIELDYDRMLELCLKIAKFINFCAQHGVQWYKNQRITNECDCVLKLLHGLISVQYSVLQRFLDIYSVNSHIKIESTLDLRPIQQTVQLSLVGLYDILVRLGYREYICCNREAQNQMTSLMTQYLDHMLLFNFSLNHEYMLDALQTYDTLDYPEQNSGEEKPDGLIAFQKALDAISDWKE